MVYVLEEVGHFGAWYGAFDRSEIEKLQELEREKAEEKLDEICTLHLARPVERLNRPLAF